MSPGQDKELFAPIINSITLTNVHDAVKETWSPGHRLVLVTGNAELTEMEKDPHHQILQAYEKSNQIQVPKPVEKKTVTFPYLPEPEKEGRIVRTKKISDLGITQIDFENGIRLNLKKTDFPFL